MLAPGGTVARQKHLWLVHIDNHKQREPKSESVLGLTTETMCVTEEEEQLNCVDRHSADKEPPFQDHKFGP